MSLEKSIRENLVNGTAACLATMMVSFTAATMAKTAYDLGAEYIPKAISYVKNMEKYELQPGWDDIYEAMR